MIMIQMFNLENDRINSITQISEKLEPLEIGIKDNTSKIHVIELFVFFVATTGIS